MIDKEVKKFVVKVVSSSDGKPAFLEAMFFFFQSSVKLEHSGLCLRVSVTYTVQCWCALVYALGSLCKVTCAHRGAACHTQMHPSVPYKPGNMLVGAACWQAVKTSWLLRPYGALTPHMHTHVPQVHIVKGHSVLLFGTTATAEHWRATWAQKRLRHSSELTAMSKDSSLLWQGGCLTEVCAEHDRAALGCFVSTKQVSVTL